MRVCTPAAARLNDIVAVSSATRHIFAPLRHDSKYQISISVSPTAHLYRTCTRARTLTRPLADLAHSLYSHAFIAGVARCRPKHALSIEFAGKHQLIRVAVAVTQSLGM